MRPLNPEKFRRAVTFRFPRFYARPAKLTVPGVSLSPGTGCDRNRTPRWFIVRRFSLGSAWSAEPNRWHRFLAAASHAPKERLNRFTEIRFLLFPARRAPNDGSAPDRQLSLINRARRRQPRPFTLFCCPGRVSPSERRFVTVRRVEILHRSGDGLLRDYAP